MAASGTCISCCKKRLCNEWLQLPARNSMAACQSCCSTDAGSQVCLLSVLAHLTLRHASNPTFVRLEPFDQLPVRVDSEAVFTKLVRQAFSQRRKTLRNALRDMLDADEISQLGIDPSIRAEMLTLKDFATLADRASAKQSG
jgi:PHP family Zn ribbon phosphoesterase